MAAYPAIMDCIDRDAINNTRSPLCELMEWSEEKEAHIFVAPGLTGSTKRLSMVGLSLYNCYGISLDEVVGSLASEELFNVFIQACKIRGRK